MALKSERQIKRLQKKDQDKKLMHETENKFLTKQLKKQNGK
jgi:hypothetical protein